MRKRELFKLFRVSIENKFLKYGKSDKPTFGISALVKKWQVHSFKKMRARATRNIILETTKRYAKHISLLWLEPELKIMSPKYKKCETLRLENSIWMTKWQIIFLMQAQATGRYFLQIGQRQILNISFWITKKKL